MSTSEDDALHRLAALFADPHPGLATWRSFVARAVADAGITEAAVLAEREACAKEADDEVASAKANGSPEGARFAGYVAKHIRARK